LQVINKLILGTVQLGIPYGINNSSGKPDLDQSNSILKLAEVSGITTLDTANAYGSAISIIGKYHEENNFLFKVVSKFHSSASNLETSIKLELASLNILQFEAYLFHSFSDFENASIETINVLLKLKEQALIKSIGVSVYDNAQFNAAINTSYLDIIQLPYNLLDNNFQRGELISKAKDLNKEIHIRSIFLQGLFFMEVSKIPNKMQKLIPYLNQIEEIALSEGISKYELALRYVFQNANIDKVLIGIDSVEQLKLNLNVLENPNLLDKSILARVNSIKVVETNLLNPVNWK
jgi:uncharacterized protein